MPADSGIKTESGQRSLFQYPEGSLPPSDYSWGMDKRRLLRVSIPRRVTYACRCVFQNRQPSRNLVSIPRRVTATFRPHNLVDINGKVLVFQYPEGSLPPSDQLSTTSRRSSTRFNTPKGHCHLQTIKTIPTQVLTVCFNTPKGHCHLQTPVVIRLGSIVALWQVRVKGTGGSPGT